MSQISHACAGRHNWRKYLGFYVGCVAPGHKRLTGYGIARRCFIIFCGKTAHEDDHVFRGASVSCLTSPASALASSSFPVFLGCNIQPARCVFIHDPRAKGPVDAWLYARSYTRSPSSAYPSSDSSFFFPDVQRDPDSYEVRISLRSIPRSEILMG